jgi:hypothetical protein
MTVTRKPQLQSKAKQAKKKKTVIRNIDDNSYAVNFTFHA